MAITKAELVSIVCDNCSFSRQQLFQIVDHVFQILKETLEKGEKIKISGFGNFVVREKRPQRKRNPQTGEEGMISGRQFFPLKPMLPIQVGKTINQESRGL